MSAGVRWTPWARTVPGPSRPVSRSTSIGVRPWRARTAASSAAVSQAWTWTRAPCSAASAATARSWSSDSRYVLCGATQRRSAGVARRRSVAHVSRASNERRSGPAASTNTGPSRRSKPAARATARAASGKKYMSRAVVMPARRHSATASAVPAATVSLVSTASSAGSSRPRKCSRSRSSASPRNIVIARWVWALTSPGRTIAPWASIGARDATTAPIDVMRSSVTPIEVCSRTDAPASIVTTVASVMHRSATGVAAAFTRSRPRSGSRAAAGRPARRRRHRRPARGHRRSARR